MRQLGIVEPCSYNYHVKSEKATLKHRMWYQVPCFSPDCERISLSSGEGVCLPGPSDMLMKGIHNWAKDLCHFGNLKVEAFRCFFLIVHPHLLVRAISERFLPAWAIFRVGLVSESH